MTVAALQNVAAEEVQADRALEIVVVFGFVGELVGLALDAAGLGLGVGHAARAAGRRAG